MPRQWSLARQFLLTSLLVLLVNALIVGLWFGQQIRHSTLANMSAITSLYVDSVISPYLQSLNARPTLTLDDIATLDQVPTQTTLKDQIVAFKIWSPDGHVLYSPNHALVGQQFPVGDPLARSLRGEVAAQVDHLAAADDELERQRWSRLITVYAPVRDDRGERVIAATEFYQLPERLDTESAAAERRAWGIVTILTLTTYLGLAGIVGRGSATIGRQGRVLERQLTELAHLLDQNSGLNQRVRQAARRTTTLNEQTLRRLSADLHDGPGQVLALALMRLDDLCADWDGLPGVQAELTAIHEAMRDALRDIRAISSGLLLPEIEGLSLREVVERVVRDHERRSGIAVGLELPALPAQVPVTIKVALFRTLQEALSNATRHGGGRGVVVRLREEGGLLCLAVSDSGPGIGADASAPPASRRLRLGVAGMRDRAQLLGGTFRLVSEAGTGTTVAVSWPLSEPEEAWEQESLTIT